MNPRRELRLLVCAVQLLTRLPTPQLRGFEPDWTMRAVRYYPLVGQLVGLICAAVLLAASWIWSGPLPAMLAVAVGALVTGGFHEDGLADTFDGLGGGRTREARLAVMKDSRIGTYGVLALGLVTALRIAALASLAPLHAAAALLFAHGAARASAVVVMAASPYVGDPAVAKLTRPSRALTAIEVVLACLLSLWPAFLLGWQGALAGLALAALSTALLERQASRLIGGHTGDVLGAVEQLAEAGILMGAAAARGP